MPMGSSHLTSPLSSDAALDTQRLSDAREAALQHSAVLEYELRLAKEDIASLRERITKQAEAAAAASPAPGENNKNDHKK